MINVFYTKQITLRGFVKVHSKVKIKAMFKQHKYAFNCENIRM